MVARRFLSSESGLLDGECAAVVAFAVQCARRTFTAVKLGFYSAADDASRWSVPKFLPSVVRSLRMAKSLTKWRI
jgi:hypothetical protein